VNNATMDIAKVFFEAYDVHDVDAMLLLCRDTGQLRHVPMGRFETGDVHTVGRKAWSDMFSAMPDLRVTVRSIFSSHGNVAAEVIIADRERSFELPQAYFLTVDDAMRITNVTVYGDNVGFGYEITKSEGTRLVDAIKSLGKR
jgi:hypothetical protein